MVCVSRPVKNQNKTKQFFFFFFFSVVPVDHPRIQRKVGQFGLLRVPSSLHTPPSTSPSSIPLPPSRCPSLGDLPIQVGPLKYRHWCLPHPLSWVLRGVGDRAPRRGNPCKSGENVRKKGGTDESLYMGWRDRETRSSEGNWGKREGVVPRVDGRLVRLPRCWSGFPSWTPSSLSLGPFRLETLTQTWSTGNEVDDGVRRNPRVGDRSNSPSCYQFHVQRRGD